jgi:hypothetical protein
VEKFRARGDWTDENGRPLLCELEDGVVRTLQLTVWVRKKSPFFEIIDDVLGHIIEGGFFFCIQKKGVLVKRKWSQSLILLISTTRTLL